MSKSVMRKKTCAKKQADGTSPPRWSYIVPIVVAVIAFLGTVISRPEVIAMIGNLFSDKPGIKIISPQTNSLVSEQETVVTKVKTIPHEKVWVIVYSNSDKRYYPHKGRGISAAKDELQFSGVEIGGSNENGQEFSVIALLANDAAQIELEDYAKDIASYGMDEVPKGMVEYHRIKVRRK